MKTQVWCKNCGWVDTDKVEFIDISEGPQGEDVMTFKCTCGLEASRTVYGRPCEYVGDDE